MPEYLIGFHQPTIDSAVSFWPDTTDMNAGIFIRQFAPDIMVGDAQVIPIFMPPGKDVEVSSTPTDLSFVQPGTLLQQRKFSDPLLPAGTMPESA